MAYDATWNNKPVKAPDTLMHYGKYCTRGISRGQIQHSATPRTVLASQYAPCAIFPVVHSHWWYVSSLKKSNGRLICMKISLVPRPSPLHPICRKEKQGEGWVCDQYHPVECGWSTTYCYTIMPGMYYQILKLENYALWLLKMKSTHPNLIVYRPVTEAKLYLCLDVNRLNWGYFYVTWLSPIPVSLRVSLLFGVLNAWSILERTLGNLRFVCHL